MPQHSGLQIGQAGVRVDQLTGGRVPAHRVDGEISPAEGVHFVQAVIDPHIEAAVTVAGLGVDAGERDVEVLLAAAHREHPEADANLVDGADPGERLNQVRHVRAVDLDVDTLGVHDPTGVRGQQRIADTSGDDDRAAGGVPAGGQHLLGCRGERHQVRRRAAVNSGAGPELPAVAAMHGCYGRWSVLRGSGRAARRNSASAREGAVLGGQGHGRIC